MPHDPPRRIALIGTGLIGGSLGLAIRRRHSEAVIIGYDPQSAQRALDREACTSIADTLDGAIMDADIVVLATPVGLLPDLLRRVSGLVSPDALITDVGSVKGPLDAAARQLDLADQFVGGHPMAGAENGGIDHADALLFENAVYVLCPLPGQSVHPKALWLVDAVGARPAVLDADRHDQLVATVSHLPQLVAVALVETAAAVGDDALALAAGGFRDMTRIASSPFGLWGDIYGANASAVDHALDAFLNRIQDYRRHVVRQPGALRHAFEQAASHRGIMPADARGFLQPLVDVIVWIADNPGALHDITGTLADASVDVKDIELMRIREGDAGTFRLGFADASTADRAVAAFSERGIRAQRREI
ncbi:MAG: prephenate dehydrogenase/arogenate dehydrogenase family protein [Bacteroidota bacterium]